MSLCGCVGRVMVAWWCRRLWLLLAAVSLAPCVGVSAADAGAATAPSASPPEYVFAVVADPHLNETLWPGLPSGLERWEQLIEAILRRPSRPEFLLVLGDIMPPLDPVTQQPDLTALTRAAARLPLYPVAGNRDSPAVRAALRKAFPELFGERDFYAFTRHRCRFVMVCNAAFGDLYGHLTSQSIRGQPQWPWLEAELRRAPEVDRVIVCGHVPPHPSGADAVMYLALGDQRLLADLVNRHAPAALFFGHTHARQEFRLGPSKVYVAPSSHWNLQGQPPGYLEVRVAAGGLTVDLVTLEDSSPVAGKP